MPLYTASYQWTSNIKSEHIIKSKYKNKSYYFTNVNIFKKLTKADIQKHVETKEKLNWQNFNEYCESKKIIQTYFNKVDRLEEKSMQL
jgi:hypothetical protein